MHAVSSSSDWRPSLSHSRSTYIPRDLSQLGFPLEDALGFPAAAGARQETGPAADSSSATSAGPSGSPSRAARSGGTGAMRTDTVAGRSHSSRGARKSARPRSGATPRSSRWRATSRRREAPTSPHPSPSATAGTGPRPANGSEIRAGAKASSMAARQGQGRGAGRRGGAGHRGAGLASQAVKAWLPPAEPVGAADGQDQPGPWVWMASLRPPRSGSSIPTGRCARRSGADGRSPPSVGRRLRATHWIRRRGVPGRARVPRTARQAVQAPDLIGRVQQGEGPALTGRTATHVYPRGPGRPQGGAGRVPPEPRRGRCPVRAPTTCGQGRRCRARAGRRRGG